MIEKIDINMILTDKSRYSLKGLLFISEEHSCDDSFEKLGILNPLIVQRDEEGGLHLVDGNNRIAYANQSGMTTVDAVVLPVETQVTDIITLILCDKRGEIGSSVMNRVQFICCAISMNVPEDWILESLCIPMGLKPHPDTLRACECINAMQKELRRFCHEKKFSFKQLINIASYPDDMLGLLVKWIPLLQLTASTMDEIASNLRSWLRSKNIEAADLIKDAEISEILESSMGARDKTDKLRRIIRVRQFPVLSDVNSRIEKSVSNMKLPESVAIKWDRSLENKNVGLSIDINDPENWQSLLDGLGSKEVKDALKEILDEL